MSNPLDFEEDNVQETEDSNLTEENNEISKNTQELNNGTFKYIIENKNGNQEITITGVVDKSRTSYVVPPYTEIGIDKIPVTTIGEFAFSHCPKLEKVYLGKNVELDNYEVFSYDETPHITLYINRVEQPEGLDKFKDGYYKNWGAKEIIYVDDERHPNYNKPTELIEAETPPVVEP